jgi:hypothetical protein
LRVRSFVYVTTLLRKERGGRKERETRDRQTERERDTERDRQRRMCRSEERKI